MEEISFKGEKYLKASVIAKKFGYTSDYIGQLCRAKAVKATLVGRSWYVSEESLRKHKKGRYRSNLAKSKESIQEITKNKGSMIGSPRYLNRIVSYEQDESDLLPIVTKTTTDEKSITSSDIQLNKETAITKNSDLEPNNHVNISLDENLSDRHTTAKKPHFRKPSVRIISATKQTGIDQIFPIPKSLPKPPLPPPLPKTSSHKIERSGLKTIVFNSSAIIIGCLLFAIIISMEQMVFVSESEALRYSYNLDFQHLKLSPLMDNLKNFYSDLSI